MFIRPDVPQQAGADDTSSSHHLERRTRERVLTAVSEHGPVTAAEVGRLLGLTPAAVRRHLDALSEQSVVQEHDPSGAATRGRGRPARSFVVSDAGHRALEDDYEELAAQTLRYLAEHAGPQAVEAFARKRVAGLESRFADRVGDRDLTPRARVEALVDVLTEDGYAASARPVGESGSPLHGIQLCQGHCPVGAVAEEFPAFCDAETDAISRLLGVHVQRLATLAGGAHVCTTFIPAAAPITTTTVTPATPAEGTPRARRVLHPEVALTGASAPLHPHLHERSSR